MHEACTRVGLPVEPKKDEGPATTYFVGIEMDSVAMEILLPQNKLKWLKEELSTWRGRKAYKKRVALTIWPPLPCMQSSESGKIIAA